MDGTYRHWEGTKTVSVLVQPYLGIAKSSMIRISSRYSKPESGVIMALKNSIRSEVTDEVKSISSTIHQREDIVIGATFARPACSSGRQPPPLRKSYDKPFFTK